MGAAELRIILSCSEIMRPPENGRDEGLWTYGNDREVGH